jgi:hypothetical protein
MMISPEMHARYEREMFRKWAGVRQAVVAHYQRRGVKDERKLSELCDRWLRTKGARAPIYVPYPLPSGRLKCGACFRGNVSAEKLKTRCKVCRKWNWNRYAHSANTKDGEGSRG